MKVNLDIPFTLEEAAFAIGTSVKDGSLPVNFICTDSRELDKDGIFFALGKGENFTSEALNKGFAVSAVNKNALFVKNTSEALLALASCYKKKLKNLKKTDFFFQKHTFFRQSNRSPAGTCSQRSIGKSSFQMRQKTTPPLKSLAFFSVCPECCRQKTTPVTP